MDEILRRTLLFDFYGELLTDHQQKVYQEVVFDDVSFSELAERENVSRQSIHELVRKCDRTLESYEEKLGLVARSENIRKNVSLIRQTLDQEENSPAKEAILKITDQILKEL